MPREPLQQISQFVSLSRVPAAFLAGVLLALSLLSLGCSASLKSGDGVKGDVAELQERVLELQRKAAVQEVEMARLRRQLAEPARDNAPSQRDYESAAVVDEERATIESTPVTVGAIGNIEQSDLEPDQDLSPEPPRRVESSSPQTPTGEAISQSAQAVYDKGYTLYHQGRYVDSEDNFRQFLELYPANELADNAQYWIGECRYANKDFRGALSAFQETVNRHPNGNKVPDALLKTGQVLERLGDLSSARQSYRELQRRFPESAAAIVASERLSSL